MQKKWPQIIKIEWLAAILFTLIFMIACGNSETREDAKTPGSREPLRPEIAKGLKFLREDNYEEAMRTIFAVIAKNQDDTEALSLMSYIYVKQDRLADAHSLAKRSLELDPDQAMPYVVQARVNFQTSHFSKALDLARKALLIDPETPLAYRVIGEVYLRQGLNQDALAVLKEAVKLKPNDPEIANLLGSGFIKAKQFKKALPVLLKAQEIDPDLPGVHFNLALVYAHLQNGQKAIRHISRAELLYTQAENKPWVGKTRDVRRVIAKKFKFTPDDVTS
ncbi:MAG: hypothetical protein NPINA01_16200 [Nitrospinaceae bacterium]|nr:MAG: hypothetical protein NPINA01_16200 [Nitrospinaceae bacterium]